MSRSDDKNVAFVELLLPLQRSLEVYCRRMLRDPSHVEKVSRDSQFFNGSVDGLEGQVGGWRLALSPPFQLPYGSRTPPDVC